MDNNNNINVYEESKKSFVKLKPIIKHINKRFKELPKDRLIESKLRKYENPYRKINKTDKAYVSMIFGDESYLPGILLLGYLLKKFKSKYNCVCIVQDRPKTVKIGGEDKYFPGVSKKAIDEILRLFDVVYGVDLLETKYKIQEKHFTEMKHYQNINIYATKIYVLGLIEYERILFLDASAIITRNIDYLFKEYRGNTFLLDMSYLKSKMGLNASVFIVKPSKLYYTRALFYNKYYDKIFSKYFIFRGNDEILLFASVFPDWDKKLIKLWTRCIEHYINKNCPIYNYSVFKPFKKPVDEKPNDITFNLWDNYAKEFIQKYPHFEQFFSHIHEFRNF